MKYIGYLLFVVGLGLAISCAAKLPPAAMAAAEKAAAEQAANDKAAGSDKSEDKSIAKASDASKEKAPAEEDGIALTDFPTTWPGFLAGIGLSIVGVGFWWISERSSVDPHSAATATPGSANVKDPLVTLAEMRGPLEALLKEMAAFQTADQFCLRIDTMAESHLMPFFDARRQVQKRLGLVKGAELILAVATCERLLNRVWSAASDGHFTEARSSCHEAADAYAQVEHLMKGVSGV